MPEDRKLPPGLFGSAKRLLATGLAIVQNRLELFLIERQEEKCRLVEVLIWMLVACAFGLMTLLLTTLTIIYVFWERAPVAVLVSLSLVYAGGTLWAFKTGQRRLRNPPPFAATLDELKKDQACLDAKD